MMTEMTHVIKKLSAVLLVALALTIGGSLAAPQIAAQAASVGVSHAPTQHVKPYYTCSWVLKERDYPQYLSEYHMTVTAYEYTDTFGDYCGNWKSIDSITVDAGAGSGTYSAAIWDGSRHVGPSFSWSTKSYSQSWTGTAYYNVDSCVKGDGYLSAAGNTLDNLNSNWGCP